MIFFSSNNERLQAIFLYVITFTCFQNVIQQIGDLLLLPAIATLIIRDGKSYSRDSAASVSYRVMIREKNYYYMDVNSQSVCTLVYRIPQSVTTTKIELSKYGIIAKYDPELEFVNSGRTISGSPIR